jgi:very-short-patch-repair endonuclease/predicted transcriptional regulator of viral defense system
MTCACPIEPQIGAELDTRHADERIALLAECQHGVVNRAQLIELGLGRRAIGHRLERGRLHPVHRGVYAVGHRVLAPEGRWMAAVLSGGPGAVLSYRSAAALWGLRPSGRTRVEVTLERHARSRRTVEFHRAAMQSDEITSLRGIPVTTVPRTLLDLASVLKRGQVERAVNEAETRRLLDFATLERLLARHAGRRGVPALRGILDSRRLGAMVVRSELEERFAGVLDDRALSRPEFNAQVRVADGRWIECDCVWRAQRLIVELDGHAFHSTPGAFERDRERDRFLHAAGWRVIRVTWRQLELDAEALSADLARLLGASGSPRSSIERK